MSKSVIETLIFIFIMLAMGTVLDHYADSPENRLKEKCLSEGGVFSGQDSGPMICVKDLENK